MNAGEKRASPPAPSVCCAPPRSSLARWRKSCSRSNPVFALSLRASTDFTMNGVVLACRFWLTFNVTLIS